MLSERGLRIVPERVAATAEDAAAAATALGFPVVVKVLSRDITHKTEVGGVRLGLRTRDDVLDAFDAVVASARAAVPSAAIEGVIVARQVEPVAELLLGVKRDPLFGPVVVAGLGGVLVEILRDVSMRLPPVDQEEALAMLRELRGAAVLEGARGRPRADLAGAAEAIAALSRAAVELGDRLQALDINPLFVLAEGEGVLVGDALVELG